MSRSIAFLAIAVVGALCASAVAAPAVEPAEEIRLAPGEATRLEFDEEIGNVIVANPETADVEILDGRNVFVLGLSPNVTSLKVYGKENRLLGAYAVRVHAQSLHAETVVAHIAGEDSDVSVNSVGDALFVTGRAASPAQAERLLRSIRAVSGNTPVVDALSLKTPAQVNLEVGDLRGLAQRHPGVGHQLVRGHQSVHESASHTGERTAAGHRAAGRGAVLLAEPSFRASA